MSLIVHAAYLRSVPATPGVTQFFDILDANTALVVLAFSGNLTTDATVGTRTPFLSAQLSGVSLWSWPMAAGQIAAQSVAYSMGSHSGAVVNAVSTYAGSFYPMIVPAGASFLVGIAGVAGPADRFNVISLILAPYHDLTLGSTKRVSVLPGAVNARSARTV